MNMAIDLASSLSPYEFENMLPLDVLAAVASETLRNEIHSDDSPEIKTTINFKKQVKKSVTSVMTFEDIKSLPVKALVDKFSEMTSDELTKKYFYKCLLVPQKCSMTFKSFGNEKKACDKIKSHLLSHVQQLNSEYESSKGILDLFFIPKSPNTNSKNSEKLSKKSLKKQQISLVLSRANPLKSSKKSKSSAFCVKKMKKKFHNMNRKRVTEKVKDAMKKCLVKDKEKMFNSVYLREKPSVKYLSDDNLKTELNSYFTEEINDELNKKCFKECYNSYNEHLQYAFLSDSVVKEEESESPCVYEQISDLNCEDNFSEKMDLSSNLTSHSSDIYYPFPQDHNYAVCWGTKSDKILSQENKSPPRKYPPSLSLKPSVLPQLIIRTPPFPYVYTPLLPEIAEIEEINFEGNNTQRSDCSNCIQCMLTETKVKREIEEVQTDNITTEQEGKFSSIFYKVNGANGSVLECVENIVNTKHSNSCVPKNEISANENDENLENLQKVEKELALKYIAKLHGKGKKKIPDSLMCQICPDKHFTAQATLIHHYRSHAGIKPYICKICSAKFTRQHSLNYHMLIHQNRSRFTCEVCSRTFRHPSHYKEHLRRHTGETPYHCTDCNLHFKTRNTFKRHLKTRHGKLLTANGIEDLNVE